MNPGSDLVTVLREDSLAVAAKHLGVDDDRCRNTGEGGAPPQRQIASRLAKAASASFSFLYVNKKRPGKAGPFHVFSRSPGSHQDGIRAPLNSSLMNFRILSSW